MRTPIKVVLISAALMGTFLLNAQQSMEVNSGDVVRLEAETFRGDISWQKSMDGVQWETVKDSEVDIFEVAVDEFPTYFRARVKEQNCVPHYSEVITVNDALVLEAEYWSEASTWASGTVPANGEEVVIPEGRRIILDVNSASLGGLTIDGILEFDNEDLELTSEWIFVNGTFKIGSPSQPFTKKAIITLMDQDVSANINGMGTRGIVVMGKLELYGATPETLWTRINGHIEKGANKIVLEKAVQWSVGDEFVLSPTDFYEAGNGTSITQKLEIGSIENSIITSSEEVGAFRWGLLQYATSSGMSLTPENLAVPPVADTDSTTTPLILDERATVGLLTRNITIQAPDDALWQNQGFGTHLMVMPSGSARVDGVEFKRAGQRGRIRRYAFHWHMLSYEGSKTLSDASGQFIRNSSVNSSANRGIVIHGTNGVEVSNNVVYDVNGHGIFTEDASERRNKMIGNLVLHVRNPPFGTELKQHEQGELGSSGFWVSNPDNVLLDNVAGDCETFGFWLAFTTRPWGLSSSVVGQDGLLLNPSRLRFGEFDGNVSHSNKRDGIMIDNVENDDNGNVTGNQYTSTTDGRQPSWPYETVTRFSLARFSTWKNGDNGIWDRATSPDNFEIVNADNCGRFFAGAGINGIIERSLIVGTSLNHMMNGTGREAIALADFYADNAGRTPSAFATYHSTFDMKNNIIVNFPLVENERSGAFATEDYYIRPVDKGHSRNGGNLLINSHPGVKLKAFGDYFSLAGALWDPNGLWGPPGNYFVYDEPFFTHGVEISRDKTPKGTGGVSVPGPFYGFLDFVLFGVGDTYPQNQPYRDLWGIQVRRLDGSFNQVATWTIAPAEAGRAFDHMRDFAAHANGIYELTFPQESNKPTNLSIAVENMLEPEDQVVLSVSYSGTLNPTVGIQFPGQFINYTALSSRDAVIASDGETWWQDKTNNLLWVKLKGGRWKFWTDDPSVAVPTDDEVLYETVQLRAYVP